MHTYTHIHKNTNINTKKMQEHKVIHINKPGKLESKTEQPIGEHRKKPTYLLLLHILWQTEDQSRIGEGLEEDQRRIEGRRIAQHSSLYSFLKSIKKKLLHLLAAAAAATDTCCSSQRLFGTNRH